MPISKTIFFAFRSWHPKAQYFLFYSMDFANFPPIVTVFLPPQCAPICSDVTVTSDAKWQSSYRSNMLILIYNHKKCIEIMQPLQIKKKKTQFLSEKNELDFRSSHINNPEIPSLKFRLRTESCRRIFSAN